MTRSIDADPFGPTIEEKVFRTGKRLAIAFAVAAVTVSALDLMYAGTVESTAAFIRDSRLHYAELPGRILAGIRQISILPNEPSVTVAIPREAIVNAPRIATAPKIAAQPERTTKMAMRAPAPKLDSMPAPKPVATPAATVMKSSSSPVAELADVRNLDAIEFAMASSSATDSPPMGTLALAAPVQAAAPAAAAAPETSQIKLASLGGGVLPDSAAIPVLAPVSLPMVAPIPLAMVPLPLPAPGVPPPSPAQRLKLEGKEYAKAERCLANAIYFEARSEPIRGQMAVAQVVINRAFSGFYPNDICGVVYQNAHRRLACQFTFACDGKSKAITERGHWARANRIAKQTLDGQIYVPEVGKSTHYHAAYVHPYWVREMRKMVRFGLHSFYRPYAWGSGADEPVWGKSALASSKKH